MQSCMGLDSFRSKLELLIAFHHCSETFELMEGVHPVLNTINLGCYLAVPSFPEHQELNQVLQC